MLSAAHPLDAPPGAAEGMSEAHTIERETLWVTDEQMARRLGIPWKELRPVLSRLDDNKHSGFPQKKRLWGDRRYWPSIKAYFDRQNGLKVLVPKEEQPHE